MNAKPVATEFDTMIRLVRERRSCRAFLPDPLSRCDIERIVDVARFTPSWCNTQPWHLHITEAEETDRFRAALRAHVESQFHEQPDFAFPSAYSGRYLERRRASGWQMYERLGIAKGDRAASRAQMLKNFDLFGAPHVAIVTTDADLGVYGAVDCGLFVQTFLLAASSMGVAATPQAAIAGQSPFIRDYFGLPEDRRVLLGISFGYADAAHRVNGFTTARQSVEEAVTWHGPR